jgi:hypothetical protein
MAGYDVPFVSQQVYTNPEWRRYGCGIASLKMVLDYWHRQDPRNRTDEVDNLYAAGVASGAFNPAFGWVHAGLVGLGRSLGYDGFNLDFAPNGRTPKSAEDALKQLEIELGQGPVIASVYRGFDPARGGGHLVVVTDVSGGTIGLNDPEPLHESDGRRLMPVPQFLLAFKNRFIVVHPQP